MLDDFAKEQFMQSPKWITKKVISVNKDASIQEAAKIMRRHHIGDVVVVDSKSNAPIGMITDRDIVMATVALNIPFEGLTVGEIMTEKVITVSQDAGIHEVIKLMRTHGVKRLPVIGAKKALIGIVSRDNVMKYLGDEFSLIGETYLKQRSKERERRPDIQ
jgi:CBS domain-containing protein